MCEITKTKVCQQLVQMWKNITQFASPKKSDTLSLAIGDFNHIKETFNMKLSLFALNEDAFTTLSVSKKDALETIFKSASSKIVNKHVKEYRKILGILKR